MKKDCIQFNPCNLFRFIRLAEESSRPAFESIESIVHAFGSVSMMLESTYHAVHRWVFSSNMWSWSVSFSLVCMRENGPLVWKYRYNWLNTSQYRMVIRYESSSFVKQIYWTRVKKYFQNGKLSYESKGIMVFPLEMLPIACEATTKWLVGCLPSPPLTVSLFLYNLSEPCSLVIYFNILQDPLLLACLFMMTLLHSKNRMITLEPLGIVG